MLMQPTKIGAMPNCCDFCETPEEGQAHMDRLRSTYGKDEAGNEIIPPKGWKILPFGSAIPALHRQWIRNSAWFSMPRNGHSTMTPMYAKPSGHVHAFAVPE